MPWWRKRPWPWNRRADILLGGDLGCLMNMAGKLQRRGSPVRVFHTVEAIAGRLSTPAIGETPAGEKP